MKCDRIKTIKKHACQNRFLIFYSRFKMQRFKELSRIPRRAFCILFLFIFCAYTRHDVDKKGQHQNDRIGIQRQKRLPDLFYHFRFSYTGYICQGNDLTSILIALNMYICLFIILQGMHQSRQSFRLFLMLDQSMMLDQSRFRTKKTTKNHLRLNEDIINLIDICLRMIMLYHHKCLEVLPTIFHIRI